jgi:ankyrin repeat protein
MLSEKEFVELAKKGTEAEVKAALAASPGLADAKEDGVSALLWAVYYGKADNARAIANARGKVDIFEASALGDQHEVADLLTGDAKLVNEYSADGFTPLGLAAYFGHLEMVKLLLAAGADPNLPSKNALGVIPLHSALSNGAKEIARVLIDAKSGVNTPNKEGWMPLHYAAYNGDMETADYLLMHGASTSQVNNIGETPAMEARTQGYTALADILE